MARLRRQTRRPDVLIVTCSGRAAADRAATERAWGGRIGWVEAPPDYYAAKNVGYAAGIGDVVAFLDVDCTPAPDWFERLVAPFSDPDVRATVGRTRYAAGFGSAFTDQIDFPRVPALRGVRNFYANNVAFRRGSFPGYVHLAGTDRGACVIAAAAARRAGVVLHPVEAEVRHHYPPTLAAWLHKRWLRATDAPVVLRALVQERGHSADGPSGGVRPSA